MGVRTNDMSLVPTQSDSGFPSAGEWAFGNGGTIVFPLGNNGDRVGVWANVATHVRPDEDPEKLQKILFGEDEAIQFNTVLIPARCWAEWTFSQFINAWVPTSASFETPIPPPGGLPDASTGDGWMVTNAFIIVPADATEIVLPSTGAELVPLVSGDMCAFFSVKQEATLVRSMVPALAHDHTALQDPISRHYPGRTYYTWIYMDGLWVPQAAAVGMAAPWAVWAAIAAAPEHVLFNNKRLRLVAPPVDPTDAATKSYIDSRPAGDVVGPAAATGGRVAVYDGATGKLIKDGSKLEADLATGPASSVAGRVTCFNGTTGKLLADGGVLATQLVTAVSGGSNGNLPSFTGSRSLGDSLVPAQYVQHRGVNQYSANFTAGINTVNIVSTTAGAVTAMLPPTLGVTHKAIVIKRVGPNNVVIDGASAELIDGQATLTLANDYESAELIAFGGAWHRI